MPSRQEQAGGAAPVVAAVATKPWGEHKFCEKCVSMHVGYDLHYCSRCGSKLVDLPAPHTRPAWEEER